MNKGNNLTLVHQVIGLTLTVNPFIMKSGSVFIERSILSTVN